MARKATTQMTTIGIGSTPAGRNPCRQRLSLSSKRPFEREIGVSRAGRPEPACKWTVVKAGASDNL